MEEEHVQETSRPSQLPTPSLAVEDHGRAVTANQQAAAWYRQAQRAADRRLAVVALRLAVIADPVFGLAVADLGALTRTAGLAPGRGQMAWERHHIEVVTAAANGDALRAAGLLREHAANIGCDPLAALIVAHLRKSTQGMTDRLPSCHPSAWPC
jgi:hypothetical protein